MATEIIKITETIQFTKTDSLLIDSVSDCIYDANGNNWYHIPYWFEKVGEGRYRMVLPENLPSNVKSRIEKLK